MITSYEQFLAAHKELIEKAQKESRDCRASWAKKVSGPGQPPNAADRAFSAELKKMTEIYHAAYSAIVADYKKNGLKENVNTPIKENMNHAALKAELEKRAKELIAKRDGHGPAGEVEEDDPVHGSDDFEDEHKSHLNPKSMSTSALRAELERRAAEWHSKNGK